MGNISRFTLDGMPIDTLDSSNGNVDGTPTFPPCDSGDDTPPHPDNFIYSSSHLPFSSNVEVPSTSHPDPEFQPTAQLPVDHEVHENMEQTKEVVAESNIENEQKTERTMSPLGVQESVTVS